MNKLRIGVIGAGGIATGIHLPVLCALPKAQVQAVCDLVGGRAAEAARTFGVARSYTSYFDMLQSEVLDAVFVLVQPDALFRVASDCLLAGKHVFMEKPMGITLYQAQALRRLAVAQNRLLHVGFNRRYIPLVVQMACEMRKLTRIEHVEGCFYKDCSPAFYGGCADAFVCDVIHVIDLVRHLACAGQGAAPQIVKASTLETVNRGTGLAQAWYSSMEFSNGVTGCIRANYSTGGRVHTFALHGPGASAYINLGFGGAGCTGKILTGAGTGGYSLAAAGGGEPAILEFDGVALAGSDRYEVYYGYAAEDALFVGAALDNPEGTDAARLAQDCATMAAVETLLRARITGGTVC
ncbi:MAG: Gfo/Idh/MocA family oxidoreductase [Eubacteriales bacterium]|nr:Gfo/Idh/MocA family oxidoreductase [Eubacteriales bacterium]